LDDVIQLTEKDEPAYQEMIAHIPMFAHPNPEDILVVGGGDGGVIRELVKHKSVKSITICEIDKMVIEVAKKYIPSVAAAWDDPRVKLVTKDGSKFIQEKENEGKYDVIIADTSDPVGPAEALFEAPFYENMHKALKPGGKVCTQAETIWINLDLIQKLLTSSLSLYANAEYASTQIPTYPCGQIGFLLGSKAEDEKKGKRKRGKKEPPACNAPVREIPSDFKLRYYSADLHRAAFVLPAFARDAVVKVTKEAFDSRDAKEKEEQEKEKEAAKKAKLEKAAEKKAAPKSKSSKKGSKKGGRKSKKKGAKDGEDGEDGEKEAEKEAEKEGEKEGDKEAEKDVEKVEKNGEKEKEEAAKAE